MSDGWLALVLVHLAATWAMVGLMWTIHSVHYPLFGLVGEATYGEFQDAHMSRISRVLLLPWGAEVVTAGLLVLAAPTDGLRALAIVGALGIAAVLGLTAFGAAPIHGRLRDGFDADLHGRLLRLDAIRTIVWTARGAVSLAVAWGSVT